MRGHSRFVCRIVSKEIFGAVLELGGKLPADLHRARFVCLPVVIAVLRHSLDHELRGSPASRGPSMNAIAASLGIPFETVRRNVRRLQALDMVRIGEPLGLSMPDPWPPLLIAWRSRIAMCMHRIARQIDEAGIAPGPLSQPQPCEKSAALAALDLMLVMADTADRFGMRYPELMLVHYICGASVSELAGDPALALALTPDDAVPPASARGYVSLGDLATTLGVSRSTLYRLAGDAAARNLIERRGHGVRATESFLSSPEYIDVLRLLASRTATLFARLRRHTCSPACRTGGDATGTGTLSGFAA